MSLPYIVLGDTSSHGGRVISADPTSSINNKGMARVGDWVACPRCKGVFPIIEGDPGTEDSAGRLYARHLDKTACGASLISSQSLSYYVGHGGAGGQAAADSAANAAKETLTSASKQVAVQTPTLCLDCLTKAAAKGTGLVVRG
jgi:uncharacterized Zn-binding protein involved in type VI secretion